MSKRPLETSEDTDPAKKTRVSTPLDDIKTKLDQLLKQASEHHEEARLTAVDSAFELEESWKDAENEKQTKEIEIAELTKQKDAYVAYEAKIKESPLVKMLQNVSESDAGGIEKLTEDHTKLTESLKQLKMLQVSLLEKIDCYKKELEGHTRKCQDLKHKHEEAEAHAEKIAGLHVSE